MQAKTKVLLVDDEQDFTQPMSSWLTAKGYSVRVANDGEGAIKIVKEDTPDIVFLDLKMPVMDGVEVLRRIREFNKTLPVIVITAYIDDPKAKEVNSYGISGVFYKGADFMEGLSLIESVLRISERSKNKK